MATETILVVDDNEAGRYVVGRVLRHAGYQVFEAGTGAETLAIIRRERPDLVVLDVTLPDMNGYDICRQIKADTATSSILVLHLSATFVHARDAVRGLESADGYLTQPVDPPVLIATARALLRIRQVEAALRESETRHRTLFEHNPVPTWVLEATAGRVIAVNTAAVEQYGYSRGEFLTMAIDDLGHPLDGPGVAPARGPTSTLWQHRTKSGAMIEVELTEAALTIGAEPVRLVMAEDVTDRRQAEQVRADLLAVEQRARQDAEAANRMKDEFLAMLGHELRNPLSAIATALAIVERTSAEPATVARALTIAGRQMQHLGRLLDDLLDVGRLMAGKMSLQPQLLDLAAVASQTVASFQTSVREAGHQLVVDFHEVWIRGDGTRLDQIVGNLLSNAVKYTPRGGTITVEVRAEGDEAVLTVGDTGMGIDATLLPRIFELFVQGTQALDRSRGGLGLGLTLVKRLVELHGGKVEAASDGTGRGSRFTVRIPASPRPAPAPPDSAPSATRRRIVIVEDHDDSRTVLRQLLELEGHEVYEAADGPAGVAEIVERRPEVALVDLGLPGLDGYEVARRIRKACGEGIHVVALTGYDFADFRRRSREAGFDDHLMKPVAPDLLRRVLERARRPSGS